MRSRATGSRGASRSSPTSGWSALNQATAGRLPGTVASIRVIRRTTSGSIRRTTSRRSATATSHTCSYSVVASSLAFAHSSGAPAIDGWSAALLQSGFRPELDDQQAEERKEREIADEDPPGENLPPVVNGPVARRKAVPLEVGQPEHGDEQHRRGETRRGHERHEPRRVLG